MKIVPITATTAQTLNQTMIKIVDNKCRIIWVFLKSLLINLHYNKLRFQIKIGETFFQIQK